MGQLALSLAGAGIGFLTGGVTGAQIGWTLGAFAWNLLDPPKVASPRMQDTTVRGGDYGTMVPIVYGTVRVGGIPIGQGSTSDGPNKFTEHKQKSGGKGSSQPPSYTYSLSFFNALCEGPIAGVLRRWANGRLVTEAYAESNDTWPYTLYTGTATQTVDPTMETIYGSGEVAPMRGVAYEAITEIDVEDYGRARPNVEYEIFTDGGDIPWRVSSFSWTVLNQGTRQVIRDSSGNVVLFNSGGTGVVNTTVKTFQTDGTQVGSDVTTSLSSVQINWAPSNLNVINGRIDPGDSIWFLWNESLQAWEQGETISTASAGSGVAGRSMYKDGYIYAVRSAATIGMDTVRAIYRFACPNKIPGDLDGTFGALPDALTATHAPSGVFFGHSNDDYVWVIATNGSGDPQLYQFDNDLSLVHHWTNSDLAGTNLAGFEAGQFMVRNGIIAVNRSVGSGTYEIALTSVSGTTLTDVGVLLSHGNSDLFDIGGGLGVDTAGVFSLNPPAVGTTLGAIVGDLLERAGLTSDQYDVSDLTQDVRGFAVASQMEAKNAIDVLRRAYFFDVSTYDGKVVCRNRGHDADHTIPDGDLAAHVPGNEPPDPLAVVRVPEDELPRTVWINYYDYDNAYQSGSQYWTHPTTLSQSDVTLDLPLVLTGSEALQRALTHIHFAYLERDRFTFYVSDEWSKLRPMDVVVVRGVNIRLTSVTESPDGILKCEGVRAFAGGFTEGAPVTDPVPGSQPGAPAEGQPPQEPPSSRAPTRLVLLDLPILSQYDAPYGFYAAACRATAAGVWPGYTLYKSLDGGATYEAVTSTSEASVIGSAVGVLADYGGSLSSDDTTSTVDVTLDDPAASLESATSTAFANGANLCAIRCGGTWEILQFRDATLISTDSAGRKTYTLDGAFKRGRKGTPVTGHAAGDTFVLLPTLNVDAPAGELNLSLKYKAVTFGTAVADASAIDFTNTGEAAGGSNGDLGNGSFDEIAAQFPIKKRLVTAGTYTLLPEDRAHLLQFQNGSGVTVTMPDDLPKHWWCFTQNIGAGDVDLDPSGGAAVIDDNGGAVVTLATDQGLLLQFDGTDYATSRGMGTAGGGGGGGGSALTVKDEGSTLDPAVTSIDFVGGGVTATNASHAVTVTVPLKAPLGASYVTLGTDADLTSERVLTGSSNVTVTDAGAGSTVTLDLSTTGVAAATYGDTDNLAQFTVNSKGRITYAANVPFVGRIHTMQGGVDVDLDAIALNFLSPLEATDAGSGVTQVTVNPDDVGGFSQSERFDSTNTFTAGANVSVVFLTGIANGGAGGGKSSVASSGGGGGGSGEQCTMVPVRVTPGASYTVTIPSAATGVAGATGNDGGDVTFGSLFTLKGGKGGNGSGASGAGGGGGGNASRPVNNAGALGSQESAFAFGGSSGGGGGNTTSAPGQTGGPSGSNAGAAGGASASTQAGGGGGASSPFGVGGTGGAGGSNGSAPATANSGAGGGGGGGKTTGTTTGGDGAQGYLLVTWYGAP